jgi:5-methylcytosine-specific restriction enzyme subunit McrC
MTNKMGASDYREYLDDQKMHKLYEKFIFEYYKYHYSNLSPASPQVEWDVECDEYISLLPKMQTDIALYKDDKMLIIDAKFYNDMYQRNSLYDKETFKSNNLYQIYTYVKNKDKENTGNVSGMLLYVKTDDNEKKYFECKMGKNKISICNLDLSKDFDCVKEQLNGIAEQFVGCLENI